MIKFKESALAHKYCKGIGIEIGAAAHNSFGLENCINIAPVDDFEFFKKAQIDMCGEFAKVDRYGTAERLPAESNKYDYVISSHVIEHVADPIYAFWEWNRVLKPGGVVFMIFPKRNALPSDVGRPITEVKDFISRYNKALTDFTVESGHLWVFTLQSMIDLINYCNKTYKLGWEILEANETDGKVGNGHEIVCRKT